jgi:hypothetical protein
MSQKFFPSKSDLTAIPGQIDRQSRQGYSDVNRTVFVINRQNAYLMWSKKHEVSATVKIFVNLDVSLSLQICIIRLMLLYPYHKFE